jgi:hypothetical protein
MTFAELQAALHAYVHREDQETTSNEVTALNLAAAAIVREFTPREAWSRVTLQATDDVATLPADFVSADVVSIESVGALQYLDPREWATVAGTKSAGWDAYTIGGASLYLPAGTSECTLAYYARPPAISGGSSNWLSEQYPDVWLHAALAEQWRYLQDEEASGWAAQYWRELAVQALRASRAGAQSGGLIRMRGR